MFSTMPSTGTSTFWNMRSPLRASSSAMSCGVVTMTAPLTGTRCDKVSWCRPCPAACRRSGNRARPSACLQQLHQRLRHHRAAPDHRLLCVDQEADRHHFHAVRLERIDALADRGVVGRSPPAPSSAAGSGRRCPHRAGRPRRPVERQREREVGGRRRLAHAALAGRDGDDVADARQRLQLALARRARRPASSTSTRASTARDADAARCSSAARELVP